MNFFTKNPNLKKKELFRGGGGDGDVKGARVSDFFLLRIQI